MRLLGRIEPGSGSGIFTGHSESREASVVRSESRRVESLAVLSTGAGRRAGGMVSCAVAGELLAARTINVAERRRRGDAMLRLIVGVRVPVQCRGKTLSQEGRVTLSNLSIARPIAMRAYNRERTL